MVKFKRDDINGQIEYGIKKEAGTKVSKSDFWETPIDFKTKTTADSAALWRKVKKVVVHSEFISEALSWKGGGAIENISKYFQILYRRRPSSDGIISRDVF